jgi:hypothetical protein
VPPVRRPARTPPVVFDDAAWAEDLAAASERGREVAIAVRDEFELHGAPLAQLRECEAEGPDGTRLGQCLKVYLPPTHGAHGVVLKIERDRTNRRLRLVCIAFGPRHPPRSSNTSRVYEIADRRLYASLSAAHAESPRDAR